MSYKVLRLEDSCLWNNYLQRMPLDQQDVYFTPDYYAMYEWNGDGKAECFVYEDNGELLLYPYLLNSVNSLGYKLDKEYYDIQGAYGYNGVVTSSKEQGFLRSFYECFEDYCRSFNIIAEFTRFHPLLSNYELNFEHFALHSDRNVVYLDLDVPYDVIWKEQYSPTNRNKIRRSIKNGNYCVTKQNPTLLEIDEFISIYELSMNRVNADKYYLFSDDYYEKLFGMKGFVYLLSIKNKEGETTCSAVFFHYADYFHYHLSGRSDSADSTVNNLLLDNAVRLAQSLGVKKMHFGGGTSSSETDSLLMFKSNFSKQRAEFYIGKKIYDSKTYEIVREQWQMNNPDAYENNKSRLLGYRDI